MKETALNENLRLDLVIEYQVYGPSTHFVLPLAI